MEYILYFDESDAKGKYYSNFYGGALVAFNELEEIDSLLNKRKQELGLYGEIKWSKVSSQYLDKYKDIMSYFFNFIKQNKVKIRIMFKPNCYEAQNLTKEQRDNEYFLLYYQFCKHAFGLQYSNPDKEKMYIRMYFDKLPDTKEKILNFKEFIYNLQYQGIFWDNNIKIRKDDIVEVISHDHVILQCMDIILGAMQFRLNDKHLEKVPGTNRRGKKTIAKEKLYKHINKLIREIYPNFNIGISTGRQGDDSNSWKHPYRHWEFIPSNSEYDETRTKNYAKSKCSISSTNIPSMALETSN